MTWTVRCCRLSSEVMHHRLDGRDGSCHRGKSGLHGQVAR